MVAGKINLSQVFFFLIKLALFKDNSIFAEKLLMILFTEIHIYNFKKIYYTMNVDENKLIFK
jgi:hypothetical protein